MTTEETPVGLQELQTQKIHFFAPEVIFDDIFAQL
jgi:hypothetical protein